MAIALEIGSKSAGPRAPAKAYLATEAGGRALSCQDAIAEARAWLEPKP